MSLGRQALRTTRGKSWTRRAKKFLCRAEGEPISMTSIAAARRNDVVMIESIRTTRGHGSRIMCSGDSQITGFRLTCFALNLVISRQAGVETNKSRADPQPRARAQRTLAESWSNKEYLKKGKRKGPEIKGTVVRFQEMQDEILVLTRGNALRVGPNCVSMSRQNGDFGVTRRMKVDWVGTRAAGRR